jgi:hypothetical protein
MKRDKLQQVAASYLRQAPIRLGVEPSLVEKYLKPAIENIQAELDNTELRDFGIIPAKELQAIIPMFQKVAVEHLSDYAEWLAETFIGRFQVVLLKEINRISEVASFKYLQDNGITEEQLKEIMQQPLFKDKESKQEIKE